MYRTCMFGSKILSGEIFENNKFVYNSDLYVDDRNKNIELVNFSMRKLDMSKAINYATKALEYDSNYNEVIIELGEYDIIKYLINRDSSETFFLKSFKHELETFTELFKKRKIKIVLMGLTDISADSINEYLKTKYNSDVLLDKHEFSNLVLKINQIIFSVSARNNIKFVDSQNIITDRFDEFLCNDKGTYKKKVQSEIWNTAKKLVEIKSLKQLSLLLF